MDQEIKKLEQLKQQEILLMQQIYEKKINYLNTKIQLLTEESQQKDIVLQNLKNASSENHIEQQDKTQDIKNLEMQKQKMDDQKDKELQKLKTQYQLDLQNIHQQMRNRDSIIEQMKLEIKMFEQSSKQNLDDQKVQILSQIMDVCNELLVQL
ncbi:unnamed protein product (macronuclear) [Paramecium tetraurelia]|uniref:Uncharacterized protein n=1 Tax=Paramecium tetraurelia TaxID=5888 RepID=A0BT61_PARTE|nr:uncharacterized protein GSPATT00031960001 [Paramecium tetraurelia]CAK61728.1 unnamed protein product [Paramecium tetraurelia]|eukprot:XP_001429126.1 hypothetical protein (macronuclear) [Paramecium tetraurelia strain d4-2]